MPTIIILDFWEHDKLNKIVTQFNSFDEMPTATKDGIIEIKGKKYRILSRNRTLKSDFTDHHKTADNEIYEVMVEQL